MSGRRSVVLHESRHEKYIALMNSEGLRIETHIPDPLHEGGWFLDPENTIEIPLSAADALADFIRQVFPK